MTPELLPIIMAFSLLCLVFSGYPVAFILGGVSIYFIMLSDTEPIFFMNIASRMMGTSQDWLLLSVPVFIFMGIMMDKSGIAGKLLYSLDRAMNNIPGGLAISVIIFGTIMAATTGIIGASVVMLGLIALPVMLKEKYNPCISGGLVAACGTLGILIPPSIMLVMFSSLLQIPVGALFSGVLFPSFILVVLYTLFIFILGLFFPKLMPRRKPVAQIQNTHAGNAWLDLFKNMLAPLLLILAVLGSIFTGMATPTEGAALGALGAIILTIANGNMNRKILKTTVLHTGWMTGMCLFIALCAPAFSAVFREIGGVELIKDSLLSSSLGPYAVLFILQASMFLLGFFMEWLEISYILLPMFASIVASLDFGLGLTSTQQLTWFAVMAAVNLQTSFLTPPFGMALFYVKGVANDSISIKELYLGAIPFMILQLIAVVFVVLFPRFIV